MEADGETRMMNEAVPESWKDVLAPVLDTPEARRLGGFLRQEEKIGKMIYPPRGERLSALELTPLEEVKVAILGQDPYHGPKQAHGLAFSVREGMRLPPSLANIYKELEADCGIVRRDSGDLSRWARQGVLLLNNTLTVEAGAAGSHARRGWEAITDACVRAVAERDRPCVFILWGNHAQAKAERIEALRDNPRLLVIETPHPSPLSARRGFFGSRPFSRTNAFLKEQGIEPVEW